MTQLMILAHGGSFRVVSEHIRALSPVGMVVLAVMCVLAVILAATARYWFRAIAMRSARRCCHNIEWMAGPRIGPAIPIFLFLILFPALSVFSSRVDTWWTFLIFGWLGAVCVWMYVFNTRHMTTALMYADDSYFLSRHAGVGGWQPAEELDGLSVHTEKSYGGLRYALTHIDAVGERHVFGYVIPVDYPPDVRPEVISFLRSLMS